MKVAHSNLAPIGAFAVREDGEFLLGPSGPAMWKDPAGGYCAETTLGEVLTTVDLERLTSRDSSDMEHAPALAAMLRSLCEPTADGVAGCRNALILAGFAESSETGPHGRVAGHRKFGKVFKDGEGEPLHVIMTEPDGIGRWTVHAEINMHARGWFRIELFPFKVDKDERTHVEMLLTFLRELDAFAKGWGKRLAPDDAQHTFRLVVENVADIDCGVAEKTSVRFRVEGGNPPAHVVRRAAEAAEHEAYFDEYDTASKIGYWYLVDQSSQFKAGDIVTPT